MAWVPYRESVYFKYLGIYARADDGIALPSFVNDELILDLDENGVAGGGSIIALRGHCNTTVPFDDRNVPILEFTMNSPLNGLTTFLNQQEAPPAALQATGLQFRVTPINTVPGYPNEWINVEPPDDGSNAFLHYNGARLIDSEGLELANLEPLSVTDNQPGIVDDIYGASGWMDAATQEFTAPGAQFLRLLAPVLIEDFGDNAVPGEYGVTFLLEVFDPEPKSYNCDCDDENPSRTLGELRTELTHALGFVPAQTLYEGPSLHTMIETISQELEAALGFFGPIGVDAEPVTLAQARTYLNARLGFAANATPAPGHYALLDAFINEAQDTVARRFEYDSASVVFDPPGYGIPIKLVADTDVLTVDPAAVKMLALGNAKAHFGHQDARVLLDQFEAYLKGQITRQPPRLIGVITQHIKNAQRTIWRRYGYDTYGNVTDPDFYPGEFVQVDPHAVHLLALGQLKGYYGQPDAKLYLEQYETYMKELLARRPVNLDNILNTILINAQEQLYRKYTVLRTERFYSWPLQEGVKFYDFAENEEACTKKMDPRRFSWVGVSDESNPQNGWWRPLVAGIKPEFYSLQDQSSWPTHYEIRQCIEVWPVPDASANTLRIKGHFGLEPFADDNDKCTIDDTAVYLYALANAKGHFRQPDAAAYMKQAQDHIRNLTSGLHQTRRYVPREESAASMPRPQWTGPLP